MLLSTNCRIIKIVSVLLILLLSSLTFSCCAKIIKRVPEEKTAAKSPAIVSFLAEPAYINPDESTTLRWEVSEATEVTIEPGIGSVSLSDSIQVTLSASTVYTLTAKNPAGIAFQTLTVTVAGTLPPLPQDTLVVMPSTQSENKPQPGTTPSSPSVITATIPGPVPVAPSYPPVINYFTANPSAINAGEISTISWNVTGASFIFLDHGGGYVSASGYATANPSTTTSYTLTATNAAGTVTKSATVTVAGAPPPPSLPVISSFTASPASINAGGNSTLSWNVTGATSVSISGGVGSVSATGTKVVSPAATISYTLTATNAAGTVTKSATVTVAGAPPPVDATACEQALFDAVNVLRTGSGRAALTRNAYIDGLCRQHAQYMANNGAISHDNATSRFNSIIATIPGINEFGENVLQGLSPCNATALAQLWWNSPGHKANILEAKFTISGMGLVIDNSGKIWACQIFVGP